MLPSITKIEELLARFGLGEASFCLARECTPVAAEATAAILTQSDLPILPGSSFIEWLTVRPYAPIYPASIIKLPLAVAALSAFSQPDVTQLRVEAKHLTQNDAPSPFVLNYEAAVSQHVDHMLRYSDNVATNVLLDAVGRERATDICADLGLQATKLRRYVSGAAPRIDDPLADGENAHPSADAARLFEHIALQSVPGAKQIFSSLSRQHWQDKLQAGLLPTDLFAHKTGDTSDVSHDGGILHTATDTRYILVLYTELASNAATDRKIASWMQALRSLLD